MEITRRVNKEKIIETLAEKYQLPERQVADIVNSEWKFLAKTIEQGEFDGIQLPHIGKFHVLLARLQKLNIKLPYK